MKKYKFADEPKILKRLRVRQVVPNERAHFDELLKSKHYLSSARIGGQSLRYVAELDGQWVALACFSAAALHLKAREKWIGWSPRQRARRLSFVVNNSRYLVLTERQELPNLASRALGMFLRRLSRDWQAAWGHPVVAVESFVDETRYRGVCYRACGFEAVGMSAGFSRDSRDFYHEHGKPKQLYIKALHKDGRTLLRRARLPKHLAAYEEDVAGPCPFRGPALGSLFERFRALHDGRRGHGLRHRQSFVLACAAVAVMMGAGGYKAIESKSNEIPAFPKLLRSLPNRGHALVTADAMHCQQESARVTTQELGWDYMFGLKGNQDGILQRAERLLKQQAFPP